MDRAQIKHVHFTNILFTTHSVKKNKLMYLDKKKKKKS